MNYDVSMCTVSSQEIILSYSVFLAAESAQIHSPLFGAPPTSSIHIIHDNADWSIQL